MAHERMSQYGGGFADHGGRMGLDRASELVEEHPGYSALACFGVGLAVGAAVTMLLLPDAPKKAKHEKAWYEDYLPDEDFIEDLSEQVRETVRGMLPEAVARYFKHR